MFCLLKKMKFQLSFTVLTYYCIFKNQLQIIFTFGLLLRRKGKSSKVQCNC